MINNDILRRLRYILNTNNQKMLQLFDAGGLVISESQLMTWMKREDDEGFEPCPNASLAHFLNGLVIDRRGQNESSPLDTEVELNNNLILRKLKIAFDLRSEDILRLLKLADFRLGKAELSAFFRRETHKHYRECKDQILRNFLTGLRKELRP
jgi:uncharacterized protein YehS (DUF1456 family)